MNEALAELPLLLADHLRLSLLALTLALLISLPGGIALASRPAARSWMLGLVGVLQTIPSLALLALMVPVLAALSPLAAQFGWQLPVLGFLPAVTALTIYGLLPILRNTVTGIAGVDAELIEAGRGLGMTPAQMLRQVQLPLAAPVIFAGIRTAAVWVVGTATLATPVGQRCLGDLIFGGLQTRNWSSVLLGCIAAAVMAIVLDSLLAALERAPDARRRFRIGILGGLILAAALALPSLLQGSPGTRTLTVGAKGFSEQFVLARLLKIRLQRAGYSVQLTEGLGSTVVFEALGHGDVDLYVDYSGTLWANHLKRSDVLPSGQVLTEIESYLAAGELRLLGALGFENAYAVAVRQADAQAHGWRSLDDLAADSGSLTMGGDYEFFQRPEWLAVRDAYGLEFAQLRRFDPTFMYEAVAQQQVDAISAFSSDGRISAYELTTLSDPRQALPPYDAVLLLGARAASDPAVVEALEPLRDAISIELMREANRRVDQQGLSPAAVARWLDGQLQ